MSNKRYQTVLLLGAPGAGKGTQGKILGQIPGFFHLSCGEVFRTIDIHSELGRVVLRTLLAWRARSRRDHGGHVGAKHARPDCARAFQAGGSTCSFSTVFRVT